ncbi:ABC transporter ATP-binding protein [Altericista sp. CCNU0014]|uniref:ABC transporter ATP-binding protein n=1 Tax=Altericista sp. CCNU0014 TaxID=3082949 RepID=UPI00385045EB
MSEVAIKVRGLGKRYDLFHQRRGAYLTLREQIQQSLQAPFVKSNDARFSNREVFWALKDVSFEIEQGEVIGIIGRNGAGKSTLLKILSRITEPSAGRIEIAGRVASLLEVGTGFHGELTGRENIFLNGAILGMGRAEINRKFEEIVAFAEVERFLDTPVKRYSSGMYVRLAFAVAAHLEPDILIVDEVLAVGDAAFQKKCLGKMGEVATQEARTVLFVSHNMSSIQALCQRTFWFNSGALVERGDTQSVVREYLQSTSAHQETPLAERRDRDGDGSVRLLSIRIESTESTGMIRSGSCLKITLRYQSQKTFAEPHFLISIYDHISSRGLFRLDSRSKEGLPTLLSEEGSITCITEPIRLTPGRCFVNVRVKRGLVLADYVQSAAFFDVEAENIDGTAQCPERDWVVTVVRHRWLAQ